MLILSTNSIVLIEYSNYQRQRRVNVSSLDVQIPQQFLMTLSRISIAIQHQTRSAPLNANLWTLDLSSFFSPILISSYAGDPVYIAGRKWFSYGPGQCLLLHRICVAGGKWVREHPAEPQPPKAKKLSEKKVHRDL